MLQASPSASQSPNRLRHYYLPPTRAVRSAATPLRHATEPALPASPARSHATAASELLDLTDLGDVMDEGSEKYRGYATGSSGGVANRSNAWSSPSSPPRGAKVTALDVSMDGGLLLFDSGQSPSRLF